MICVSLFTGRRRQYECKILYVSSAANSVVLMQRACTQVTGHSRASLVYLPVSLVGIGRFVAQRYLLCALRHSNYVCDLYVWLCVLYTSRATSRLGGKNTNFNRRLFFSIYDDSGIIILLCVG